MSMQLLKETLYNYVHHYKMRDEQGRALSEQGGIWLSELNKFHLSHIDTEDQRWLKFLKDGEQLNDEALPDWMNTQEMKQAMSTLSRFSEKERQYYQYQARQEYLREQRTIQLELDQNAELLVRTERDLLEERREKLEAQQREAAALAEIQRLKALLAEKGQ